MSKAFLYFRGVPTKPDVDKLRAVFGVPGEDVLITYDSIAEVIGSPRGSSRFHTVMNAWRNALEVEHKIVMRAEPGKGLVAMPPNDLVCTSVRQTACKMRQAARWVGRSIIADRKRLTPENKRAADHLAKVGAALKLAAATAAPQLSAATSTEEVK